MSICEMHTTEPRQVQRADSEETLKYGFHSVLNCLISYVNYRNTRKNKFYVISRKVRLQIISSKWFIWRVTRTNPETKLIYNLRLLIIRSLRIYEWPNEKPKQLRCTPSKKHENPHSRDMRYCNRLYLHTSGTQNELIISQSFEATQERTCNI